MNTLRWIALTLTIGLGPFGAVAVAQLAPEIGYVHPAGGQVGSTVDVVLGGYDWTPDMQLFVHDSRVQIELLGPPSPVLITEPPYWFGAKARGYAWPLPREFRARLTIPADVEPGFVRWQVANANGVSPTGVLHLTRTPEVIEDPRRITAQELPDLPVIVSGQIRRIEEVDRYIIRPRHNGMVTVELLAHALTSPTNPMSLHGVLQVQDEQDQKVADYTASEGNDLTTSFRVEAGREYRISLHDLDFAGDRSYVYRLLIHPGPRVMAAYPAGGKRGERRMVEFVGRGIETGADTLESVTREIPFPPGEANSTFEYVLETPQGPSRPYQFFLSDHPEHVGVQTISELPAAVTGRLDKPFQTDRYSVTMKQGEVWQINARSQTSGPALDLDLTIISPDGTELASIDDVPGSTDPELLFTALADGVYRIDISDRSSHSGHQAAAYRISFERPEEGLSLKLPESLSIPLGTTVKLPVAVTRRGSYQGPVPLQIEGLPSGVTTASNLVIPEMLNELVVELVCAPDVAVSASLARITAQAAGRDAKPLTSTKSLVMAITMQPRIKITPEGLDDVSKVRRGSTHLFPLNIQRTEGFDGEITLEMTAKQQRHRQGLASDEMIVPSSVTRVEYPIFVPEWMETTKTSRMILNGAIRVPDPQGNIRTLLQRMELRLGILPEGAILKLGSKPAEYSVPIGGQLSIPLTVSCLPEFREPIRIELVPQEFQQGLVSADSITLRQGESSASLTVSVADDPGLIGPQDLVFRATAYQEGKWLVKSETTVPIEVTPKAPATATTAR
ncbi:PPC domain-containing protein [Schlesneria sp. DSM 10557]|uniref:PPC domain-containing protein n=1 Tax=Schlesneria sp. DSM 10557 TaxID=3044399 RepID=UPI0035A1C859